VKYLLDTCCLSELFKTAPHRGVVEWISAQPLEELFLSVITLGEIQKGIDRLPESAKSRRLRRQFEDFMEVYEDRVLTLDRDVLLRWGLLCGKAEAKRHPLPILDSLIAATALTRGMEVVTRNVEDMERSGVKLVNPWKS
jgi:predicted nucleic acid-binding protein